MFNPTIIQETWVSTVRYWQSVLNPDWTKIGWGNAQTTPYTMYAYYDSSMVFNTSYYAEALSWTQLNEPKWRCFRVLTLKTTWEFISKTWATTDFINLWDEASVKALTYS